MSPDTHIPAREAIGAAARLLVIDSRAVDLAGVVQDTGGFALQTVAEGREPDVGLRLTRLLFALCPVAHAVAYLGAVETALGLHVAPEWLVARHRLVLAETLAGCVWRHSISWPQLVGTPLNTEAAKQARQFAGAYQAALFPDGWQQIGGANPNDMASRSSADLSALCDLAAGLIETSRGMLKACPDVTISDRCPPMGIKEPDEAPDPLRTPREETPFAQQPDSSGAQPLKHWFEAQIDYLQGLIERALGPAMAAPAVAGTADTARGRLTHHVELDGNCLKRWAVAAPTDWNFAPLGPAARALQGVRDRDVARWIVHAFDPCVPFLLKSESSHA